MTHMNDTNIRWLVGHIYWEKKGMQHDNNLLHKPKLEMYATCILIIW